MLEASLQALLVTFREGTEAFLIVGIVVAYLRKSGRAALIRGVRAGLAVSIATCIGGAYLWELVPNQPLYEGIAALSAAALVGALLAQMLRMGRRMKGEIEARLARAAGDANKDGGGGGETAAPGLGALAGVALVTALLVTREGLEAVLYLGVQVRMGGAGRASLVGAAIGFGLAGVIAWTWSRYAHALNLKIILRVTALFLALFLFQLLVYGVHEIAESGIIPGSEAFHDATEVFGPQGRIGQIISYSLLGAPLLYVVWNRRDRRARAQQQQQSERPPAPA